MNPTFALQPQHISPVALALLNARNPSTGDYLIPAPTGAVGSTSSFSFFDVLAQMSGSGRVAQSCTG